MNDTTSLVEQYIDYLCKEAEDADPNHELYLWELVKLEANFYGN